MTEEIHQHLERSSHLLEVADELYELSYFEDAVNRLYYAMFHAATAILLHYGIQRSSHHALIAAFGQYVIKPGHIEQKYHRYLIEVFNARSESDYFPLPEITEEQVRRLLEYARDFVRTVEEHVDKQ